LNGKSLTFNPVGDGDREIFSLQGGRNEPNPIEDAARVAGGRSAPPGAETLRRIWIAVDHIAVRQLLEAFINLIPGFKLFG